MGPSPFSKVFSNFFKDVLPKFTFESFFTNAFNSKNRLGVFLITKGYPTLFLYINKEGPFLTGLTPLKNPTHDTGAKKIIKSDPEFTAVYRELFSVIGVSAPNSNDIKTHLGIFKETKEIPSFTISGEEDLTAKILKREQVRGKKDFSAAAFFSEENFKTIMKAYEVWTKSGYRFDFKDNYVLFSIRREKDKADTLEYKAVASMMNDLLTQKYTDFFVPRPPGYISLSVPGVLTTFFVRFEKIPEWLPKIERFIQFFYHSIEEVDNVLSEIVLPQTKYI